MNGQFLYSWKKTVSRTVSTGVCNGPPVHPQDGKWLIWVTSGMINERGSLRYSGERTVPVPPCPPPNTHVLRKDQIRLRVSLNDAVDCWDYFASVIDDRTGRELWRRDTEPGSSKFSKKSLSLYRFYQNLSQTQRIRTKPGYHWWQAGDYPTSWAMAWSSILRLLYCVYRSDMDGSA